MAFTTNIAESNFRYTHLLKKADYVRAQAVCIRTTNDWFEGSIKGIKKNGFDVYAWRWPSVIPAADTNHHYADSEAKFVVDHLIENGLDGYIVDPEADDGRDSDNWNDAKYADLAHKFCATVKLAGRRKNPHFLFGLTSGCDYPAIKPDIPYATFLASSDAVFPQIYWAPNLKKAKRTTPDAAWTIGMEAWRKVVPQNMTIVPILGELTPNNPQDFLRFGQIMSAHNFTSEVHIYTFTDEMMKAKYDEHWDALRRLGTTPLVA